MLLLAAHGSAEPGWRSVVDELVAAVAARRPDLPVAAGFLERCTPALASLLCPQAVVVPLLLSDGYHARTDVAAAARAAGAACSRALGPSPLLTDALDDRLREAGAPADAPVLLAAAASSAALARTQVAAQAAALAARRGAPVRVAWLPGPTPVVPAGTAVAPYLLGPGAFGRALSSWDATWVAAPLGSHPAVVHLILARFSQAAALRRPEQPRMAFRGQEVGTTVGV